MDGSFAPSLILDTLSALAEPTRLRAMRLFWEGGEHCVCELMRRLDATQSRVSRHMQVLARAGLIEGRRDGPWLRYRLHPELDPARRQVLAAIFVAEGTEG